MLHVVQCCMKCNVAHNAGKEQIWGTHVLIQDFLCRLVSISVGSKAPVGGRKYFLKSPKLLKSNLHISTLVVHFD